MKRKHWWLLGFVILGIIVCSTVESALYSIFVTEECAYHNGKEPGVLLSSFYSFPAWNGFHPFPNALNFWLTVISGAILGGCFYFFRLKNKERKKSTQLKNTFAKTNE